MGTAQSTLELRQVLAGRLAEARTRTDDLFRIVKRDALYERPIAERHRIVFYIGHLEAFDWNLVARQGFGIDPFDADSDTLFAFGIDPVGGGLPTDTPKDWPALEAVEQYCRRVREAIDRCLVDADFHDPRRPLLNAGTIFQVAIEHRLMHAETLAYMLHRMPLDRKIPRPEPPPPLGRAKGGTARIPEGAATLGLPRGDAFGWDNEFEANTVRVPAFSIDTSNVTNGAFLEFMRAGGYDERGLWSDADWEWKEKEGIRHPSFWHRGEGDSWIHRGMFAETPLALDWPVYVSHAEASAYARWRGLSLPTEAQFHRAAYGTPEGRERSNPWGDEPPAPRHGNLDFQRWDPVPVGAYPDGDSAFGVSDLVGNGWEWTSTLFGPFPGFQAFSFYPGYSANFFDGKHYVMKGASSRTAACMARRSFRNWFQAHYPYVYATFRCVGG